MPDAWVAGERVAMPWGTLAYGRRPANGPMVVLLHGSGCDAADWAPVARRLPADWDVVCPDFRGHGRSSIPAEPFTLADLADDVVALIDRFGRHPVTWVGHSLGGMVAKHIAATRPDRVARLVSIEGWTRLAAARRLPGSMYGGLSAEVAQAIRDKAQRTTDAWPDRIGCIGHEEEGEQQPQMGADGRR